MRIAVSGSHATGKSTLIEALTGKLPAFRSVPEPFHEMERQGHLFSYPPTVEDFEDQLKFSIRSVLDSSPNTIFDRCPADFVGYLSVLRGGRDSLNFHADDVSAAMAFLDLVIYVPIEHPDRIDILGDEFPAMRRRVDGSLRKFLIEDSWGLSIDVLEVSGNVNVRLEQALRAIRSRPAGEPAAPV